MHRHCNIKKHVISNLKKSIQNIKLISFIANNRLIGCSVVRYILFHSFAFFMNNSLFSFPAFGFLELISVQELLISKSITPLLWESLSAEEISLDTSSLEIFLHLQFQLVFLHRIALEFIQCTFYTFLILASISFSKEKAWVRSSFCKI